MYSPGQGLGYYQSTTIVLKFVNMAATAPPPATVAYPTPGGQPVFVQPGVPPVGVPMAMPAVAPGGVYYYPQVNGGAGGILMVCPCHIT